MDKILIISGQPSFLAELSAGLKQAYFIIESASSYIKAFDKSLEFHPDLVIIDEEFLGGNTLEASRLIHNTLNVPNFTW